MVQRSLPRPFAAYPVPEPTEEEADGAVSRPAVERLVAAEMAALLAHEALIDPLSSKVAAELSLSLTWQPRPPSPVLLFLHRLLSLRALQTLLLLLVTLVWSSRAQFCSPHGRRLSITLRWPAHCMLGSPRPPSPPGSLSFRPMRKHNACFAL